MAKKTLFGSSKRFGPRYGRRNRDKVATLEKGHRGKHKCPYCNYIKVRRLSRGIWECDKCNAKFAGKAYTFEVAKQVVKPKTKEEIALEAGDLPERVKEPEENYDDDPIFYSRQA